MEFGTILAMVELLIRLVRILAPKWGSKDIVFLIKKMRHQSFQQLLQAQRTQLL
jgi:hypothetical protein